jgi:hypothetical protein
MALEKASIPSRVAAFTIASYTPPQSAKRVVS